MALVWRIVRYTEVTDVICNVVRDCIRGSLVLAILFRMCVSSDMEIAYIYVYIRQVCRRDEEGVFLH